MAAPHSSAESEQPGEPLDLVPTSVTIAGEPLEVWHPRSVDDLIDEEAFDRDDRIPYWGAIWPSARVLATRIAAAEGSGRRLLELGCGVGLVALAAARAGFDVLATDYYAEACDITAANARFNRVRVVEAENVLPNGLAPANGCIRTRVVDWRHLPDDLGTFDFVVAADVLYERANSGMVAEVFERTMAAGGVGWLTDPGRSVAKPFAAECRRRGLDCECIDLEQVIDGAMNCVVELFEIRRRS